MAERALPLDRGADRVEARARSAARERFASPARIAGLGFFVLFSVTFLRAEVDDDGLYYFSFLRRLFGVHTPAEAYQFGSAFWNAPFWLVSQLVALRGQLGSYHAGVVGVVVASNVAVLVACYLGWRMLRELELPRGPAVLLLAIFGTPLWYYAVDTPSYKHAADALYCTAGFFFLLRATRDPRRRHLLAAGGCFGLELATRYVNVALLAGVVAIFVERRYRRQLAWVLGATGVTAAFLYALPVVRGIPYHRPPDLGFNSVADGPTLMLNAPVERLAAGLGPLQTAVHHAHFDFVAPYEMLFTLSRGLYVWTPVTLAATIGFVLLYRRERRHRRFLLGLGVAAFCLLEAHMLYGDGLWTGGGSYSNRLLTALFPFYLIGAAELVRRFRWRATALLSLAALWSVWLGMVMLIGFWGTGSSVVEIVENYTGPYHHPPPYDSMGNFERKVQARLTDRWSLLWKDLSY